MSFVPGQVKASGDGSGGTLTTHGQVRTAAACRCAVGIEGTAGAKEGEVNAEVVCWRWGVCACACVVEAAVCCLRRDAREK